MSEKKLPLGICDHCGEPFPRGVSLTTKRGPRRYCSIDCRNTANSRNGNPVRTAKLRQAVAAGRWQNPHHLHPPTPEEQSRRSRLVRLREVAEGRWRNPALAPDARAKLSRPRRHGDNPLLHAAMEKLRHGSMQELTPAERDAFHAYQKVLRDAQRTRRTPEQLARLRARWRAYWHAKKREKD